jgi:acetyl esterase/lipase
MSTPIELEFAKQDGLSLFLDVYLPSNATSDKPAPVLLYFHGA